MTSGDSRISGAGKKKLRRGCLWTLIVFIVGMYAGLAATKRALTGPDWLRHFAGITLPAPPPPVAPAQSIPPANTNQVLQNGNGSSAVGNSATGPGANPGSSQTTGPQSGSTQAAPNSSGTQTHAFAPPAIPQTPPEGGWLVGTWEITDELHPTGSQSSSVTSDYIFDVGGTGEFDTNGKKLYDIHWEDAGDYVLLTFVTDTEGDQNLKIKMKYSVNADHSLLTLAPEGKKDPRGEMYSVGPGVYHRKP
jgi:hypothetical protein